MAHALQNFKFQGSDLVAFPIDGILDNSETDFEVFMTVDGHTILYAAEGYRWERQELQELLQHGLTSLYVKTSDEKKIKTYQSLKFDFNALNDASPIERMQNLENVGADFVKFLHANHVTEACVTKGKELADSLVSSVSEDPSCVQALTGLGKHDYYTYQHSLRVSAFAVAVAHALGIKDEGELNQIALGGVFHDVGKKYVPTSIINKQGPLTDVEWQLMKGHPLKGAQEIPVGTLSYVSRQIIAHHHEKNDGTGYPNNKTRVEILPEVEIAIVADIFDALTSDRSYQKGRTRFEALMFIREKMVPDKISIEVFGGLVAALKEIEEK